MLSDNTVSPSSHGGSTSFRLLQSRVQRATGYISCLLFQVRLVLFYRLYSHYSLGACVSRRFAFLSLNLHFHSYCSSEMEMQPRREREDCVVRPIPPLLSDHGQIPLVHTWCTWEASRLALIPFVISSPQVPVGPWAMFNSCRATVEGGAISPNFSFRQLLAYRL